MPQNSQLSRVPLLSTTYFGPVQWYQKLFRYPSVVIEAHESFVKQTYRNRCIIATAQGTQALTVPVVHDREQADISQLRISDHGNWRHLHWQAITSAYGDSPFLEYYEDDLRPFFTECRWERLLDFNEAIMQKMCELLDLRLHVTNTTEYVKTDDPRFSDTVDYAKTDDPRITASQVTSTASLVDFRHVISPKHPLPDTDFKPRPYYQVFSQRLGFLPNLSILDLLLNMGPEAVFFL